MLKPAHEFALDSAESRIHSRVRRFVQECAVYRHRGLAVGDDKTYLDAIVPFLKEEFGIQVGSHETTEENFCSVRTIARFVSNKQALVLL